MTQDENKHRIERVRREPRRRAFTVAGVEQLTPGMRRIQFHSPDMHDFESSAPDDHVKLFVPDAVEGDGEPVRRDYTPRAFDVAAGQLTIDFALHDAGPATAWARTAAVGDGIDIAGPRGSNVVADDFDWYLLIGDETALPAIARRLEELRADVPVHAVLVVDGEADMQQMPSRASADVRWLIRKGPAGEEAAQIVAALAGWQPPPGDGYTFIAGEASVAQAVRAYLVERGINAQWLKASGYWTRG